MASGGEKGASKPSWRRFLGAASEVTAETAGEIPARWGQMLSFTVNVFVVIIVVLMAITGVCWRLARSGRASVEALTNPVLLITFVFLVSLVITLVVFAINRQYFEKPLRAMLAAMRELGRGNFSVRVEVAEGERASREVAQFADSFNATAEALGSLEVMRSGFVDDFSHEFKTPIVSINGFAALLLEDDLADGERREYAQVIYDESRRLATMASDILLLRQAESTTMLGEVEPVDLAELVRRSAITMQGKWGEKGLSFELDLGGEDAEAWVQGSAALLDRAVANLLDNACKFSPAGGLVRATLKPDNKPGLLSGITVQIPDNKPGLLSGFALVVENDGPAISPEAQARIFERFYQADPSHATQGAGLGLPLVARVAELHGGSVSVDSTPEGHTTFTLTLPAFV